jgi:predicted dehydrogenase
VTKPLRVGLVGLGRIFDLNCLGYRRNAGAEVVALCDSREDRLRERQALFPGAAVFQDYEAFLRHGLDVVEVLTPHPAHCDMVVAALRAGAHVSVQKPMAMTLEEADAMIAAARTAGRHLKVFENFLFYAPLVKARQLLDAGAIGRPLHFRMKTLSGNRELGWPVPPETQRWRHELMDRDAGGPLIFDHGHHMLAVAYWLFGGVRDAFAWIERTRTPAGAVVDGPASVVWRHHEPPVHGVWDLTVAPRMRIRTDYYAGHERFEITGETGLLQVHRCSDRLLDEPVLTLYADGELRAFHNLESDWGLSFQRSTEHFVRFLHGEEPRAVLTAEEGRAVLAFAHLLLRSAREGRPLPAA